MGLFPKQLEFIAGCLKVIQICKKITNSVLYARAIYILHKTTASINALSEE
jgi:hypothetical protein